MVIVRPDLTAFRVNVTPHLLGDFVTDLFSLLQISAFVFCCNLNVSVENTGSD